MTRRMSLDYLPKWEYGTNKGSVDWRNAIDCKIPFVYDDINGELEILDIVNNQKLKIKYKDIETYIGKKSFLEGNLYNVIKLCNEHFLFEKNQLVTDVKSGKLLILDQIYVKNDRKGYVYLCLNCGNKDVITEGNLKNRNGCNVCCTAPRKALKGVNDIFTTHPEKVKWLANPDDGLSYTATSHKKVDWKCPNCNSILRNKMISNVLRYGLTCSNCSDTISYPEKFVANILYQLQISFESEKVFEWTKNKINKRFNKRYDFYLTDLNTIIEIHGMQHYKEAFSNIGGRSLKEERKNDQIKQELALQNGIKHYIVIDASYSDMEYIKNSILNSELPKLLDISQIDWTTAHEFACNTLVKVVCKMWQEDMKDIKEIAKQFGLSVSTVRLYLKKGNILNWCNYNPKQELIKSARNNGKQTRKEVIRLTSEGVYIDTFESLSEASKQTGVTMQNISKVCKGERKLAGGYMWRYLN